MTKPTTPSAAEPTANAEAPTQADLSRHALELKQTGAKPEPHPTEPPVADQGMASVPRKGYPASGAFDAEGQRPVLERSRKTR